MASKLIVLVALLALGQARLVRRDAPPTSPLQDFEKHATEFKKTFDDQLNEFLKSEDTQKVNKALKESSDSVLQQLSVFSASLQAALDDAQGKGKEALEQARRNLESTATELRRQHPEVEQQATALGDRIKAAVANAVQESQKLAKDVASNAEEANEKLAPKIKAAYDDFVKQTQAVQKKFQESAAQ